MVVYYYQVKTNVYLDMCQIDSGMIPIIQKVEIKRHSIVEGRIAMPFLCFNHMFFWSWILRIGTSIMNKYGKNFQNNMKVGENMRQIHVDEIRKNIAEMCIEANYILPEDVLKTLRDALETESSPTGQGILKDLLENARIAKDEQVPMCQDTGMAVIFIEVGQDVHIEGGDLNEAIHQGVREGYEKGYLRKSVVEDPVKRVNTGDNTPAIIHYSITSGDHVKIMVAPKGFGSENMSQSRMLKPSDGIKGVEDFVVQVVSEAGPNPCPPIVVGVGVGGTLEKAALLAKQALMRKMGTHNAKPHYKELEEGLTKRIRNLGIGPQGLGGKTTALAVHVESYPTHIAGLPVVVNINCHASRHVERVL